MNKPSCTGELLMEEIDGGYAIKLTADAQYRLDVLLMGHNVRLVTTPMPFRGTYDRGWCYFGHGSNADGTRRTYSQALALAVAAAVVWDGGDDSEPPDYSKSLQAR